MIKEFPFSHQENYQAWKIQTLDKGLEGEQLFRTLLEYGILAPSTHNTQPWIFSIHKDEVVIEPDLGRALPANDPHQRYLYISLGCCIENVVIASKNLGQDVTITPEERDNATVFRLQFSQSKERITEQQKTLFSQIPERFSDKGEYKAQSIDREILKEAQDILGNDVAFDYITDPAAISELADQYIQAAGSYVADAKFREELSNWLRPNNTQAFDGMPGFVSGIPLLLSYIGPFAIRNLPPATKKQVAKDSGRIQSSPTLGLLASEMNSPEGWVEVGRAYQRLSLFFQSHQIHFAPMTALVEHPASTLTLQRIFSIPAESTPHMFFRMGYSNTDTYHTPRRPLESFLK